LSVTPSTFSYRPDIDGLRAVAVVPVVMFHAGVGFTKGGYVGVDVFFVISGYLITSIIAAEMSAGRFSFAHFYERRARRLFPALFAVLVASTVAATCLMFPPELKTYGKVLAAALAFSANMLFATGDDYFGRVGDNSPLLHTWSLAVEEQFYLLFPALLLLLFARRWPIKPVLWGIAIVSFAGSLLAMALNPILAFYLLPLRAWELLVGALLALGAFPVLTSQKWKDAIAWAGLIAILTAVGAFNKNVPFPGVAALLPVLGAAALIWTGPGDGTAVSRALSKPAVVFVGLISYSLYLWHFPIIVFYKLALGETLSNLERLLLCLVSVGVAIVSWRLIELPVRRNTLLVTRARVFAASAIAMLPLAGVGLLIAAEDGFARFYPPEIRRLAAYAYAQDAPMRAGTCFITRATAGDRGVAEGCLAPMPGSRNVLLLGDSHAAHLYPGLTQVYPDTNVMQLTASGCKPIARKNGAPRCWRILGPAFEDLLPRLKPDAVILSADWRGVAPNEVAATVRAIKAQGSRVIVFGPIVEYDDTLPRLLLRAGWRKDPDLVTRTRRRDTPQMEAALKSAVEGAGGEFAAVYGTLCAKGSCVTTDTQGDPIQFDSAHLTASGAALLAQRLKDAGLKF
jgi:peptidoglycan/LPS O-acetylase OafA/YrhL